MYGMAPVLPWRTRESRRTAKVHLAHSPIPDITHTFVQFNFSILQFPLKPPPSFLNKF